MPARIGRADCAITTSDNRDQLNPHQLAASEESQLAAITVTWTAGRPACRSQSLRRGL